MGACMQAGRDLAIQEAQEQANTKAQADQVKTGNACFDQAHVCLYLHCMHNSRVKCFFLNVHLEWAEGMAQFCSLWMAVLSNTLIIQKRVLESKVVCSS